MRQAREILQEYRERKAGEGTARSAAALREENLRRLLRHVGAAHQPADGLEARLLQAMLRAAVDRQGRPGRGDGIRRRPLLWPIWAPAAALAFCAILFATRFHHAPAPPRSAPLAAKPPQPAPPKPVQAAAAPAAPIGLVIMGELRRRHASQTAWEPIGSDASIFLGDEVRTGADSSASIVFLDSSVCRLLPNTTLRYAGTARAGLARPSLLELVRGETWNTVEKGGPPFAVRTRAATATVWGTEFGVAVDGRGKTTLRVKEGKVQLQAARASEFVTAGMQAIALPGHTPEPPVGMAPPLGPPRHTPKPGAPSFPPSGVKRPGAPGAETGGPGTNGTTFHRLPAVPAPANDTPAAMPTDSSSAPHAEDGDAQSRVPISTSR